MPIDPTIILGIQPYKPVDQIENYTKLQQLTALGQEQQLRSQQIQAATLENQQRVREAATQQAIDNAVRANTKKDADGSQSIDHQGVVNTLAQNGEGQAAMAYGQKVAAWQEQLRKADNERLTGIAKRGEVVGGKLQAIIGEKDPLKRQQMWQDELQWAYKEGVAQPGQYPDQAPDDATLGRLALSSLDAAKQAKIASDNRRAAAAEAGAAAQGKQADAAMLNAQTNAKNSDRQQSTMLRDVGNHPLVFDPVSGAYKPDSTVTLHPEATNTAQAAENSRYWETVYRDTSLKESDLNKENDRLGNALTSGQFYVNAKGEDVPFDAITRRTGESEEDFAQRKKSTMIAQKADMQQRIAANKRKAGELVTMKNDAITKLGGRPAVSNAAALSALANGQQPAPAPQGAPAPGVGVSAPPQATPQAPPQQPAQPPIAALPRGNGQVLDRSKGPILLQFLKAANGDPNKATQLATQAGWKVPNL